MFDTGQKMRGCYNVEVVKLRWSLSKVLLYYDFEVVVGFLNLNKAVFCLYNNLFLLNNSDHFYFSRWQPSDRKYLASEVHALRSNV